MNTSLRISVPDLLAKCTRLPVCPALFTRLTAALQDAQQNVCELAETVSADPVLTAKILKTANSAYYGLSQTVRSIDEAIIRLGYEEIFSMAAASRAKDLFSSSETWAGFGERSWMHSLSCAVLSRALAKRVVQRRVEDAYYTAALLHDFGKLILAQVDAEYKKLSESGSLYGDELNEREMNRYGTTHAKIGAELLRQWKLPRLLITAVENHHEPFVEGKAPDIMTVVVNAADFLSHARPPAGVLSFVPELPPRLAQQLKLEREQLTILMADAARETAMLSAD